MRDKRDRILIDGGISWQTDKLLERFPIQNTLEWQVDKTSNRYPMIVSKITEPECDPWNRPTLPWNFNQGDGNKYGWTHGAMDIKNYTHFRYTTINQTAIKLWQKKTN